MPATDKQLPILWAVTDNKPGHRNQLQGLANALSRALACTQGLELRWIEMGSTRAERSQQLWQAKNLLEGQVKPDFILCCGHRTHWLSLRLRWLCRAKLVVLMRPSLPMSWFDLCVVPLHDGEFSARNVIQTRGVLNKISPHTRPELSPDKPESALVMVGGPSKHYEWNNGDMLAQLRELQTLSPGNTQWLITSSRRTPQSFESQLQELENEFCQFVPASKTDSEWLPAQLAQCTQAWVSEDSVSMVYESLSSGAQVGLLRVPVKQENRITRGVKALLQSEVLATVDELRQQGRLPLAKAPLQEADAVAKALLAL